MKSRAPVLLAYLPAVGALALGFTFMVFIDAVRLYGDNASAIVEATTGEVT